MSAVATLESVLEQARTLTPEEMESLSKSLAAEAKVRRQLRILDLAGKLEYDAEYDYRAARRRQEEKRLPDVETEATDLA